MGFRERFRASAKRRYFEGQEKARSVGEEAVRAVLEPGEEFQTVVFAMKEPSKTRKVAALVNPMLFDTYPSPFYIGLTSRRVVLIKGGLRYTTQGVAWVGSPSELEVVKLEQKGGNVPEQTLILGLPNGHKLEFSIEGEMEIWGTPGFFKEAGMVVRAIQDA